MQTRAIVLRDTDGRVVRQMDVSDLDHDNAAAPYSLAVETWDQEQPIQLAPWGPALTDAARAQTPLS